MLLEKKNYCSKSSPAAFSFKPLYLAVTESALFNFVVSFSLHDPLDVASLKSSAYKASAALSSHFALTSYQRSAVQIHCNCPACLVELFSHLDETVTSREAQSEFL